MVVDEKGRFREENFQKALSCLGDVAEFEGNRYNSDLKKNIQYILNIVFNLKKFRDDKQKEKEKTNRRK